MKEAIKKIFEGNCILFTGAGFSFGAENILASNRSIKSANELAKLLIAKCDIDSSENIDLRVAAHYYRTRHSLASLVDLLCKEFTVSQISPDHEYIGTLKWSRLYTTNYDEILEMAYRKSRKEVYLKSATISNDPNDEMFRDRSKVVMHLNGCINNLTYDKIDTEFKLTSRSYLADDLSQSKWKDILKGDIKACDAIFFVGFSMNYDLDISRIIYSGDIKDKAHFVVSEQETDMNVVLMSDYGKVHKINLSGFVEQIKEVKLTYKHEPIRLFSPICFSEVRVNRNLPQIKDEDFYDLLIKGDVNDHILYHSIINRQQYKYFINRDRVDKVVNNIKNGQKNIMIDASLGNGKTLFLKAVAIKLTIDGYKVFFYERYTARLEAEIKQICETYDNCVIIFDGYNNTKDYIKYFCTIRTNQILLMSERTHTHDVIYDKIESLVGGYETVKINKLSEDEIMSIDELFDNYSLWKDKTTKMPIERIRYIQNECSSEICSSIISRIRSSNLADKLKEQLTHILGKVGFQESLISILISKSFNFEMEISDLADIIGVSKMNTTQFQNHPSIKEFINFKDKDISFKSSIMAQYMLTELLQPKAVIDTLILIATNLSNKSDVSKPAEKILQSIINFGTIHRSINISNPAWKAEIFRFYETVKHLACYNKGKTEIHFYLQYAIARLSDHDYAIASAYFDKCYVLAKQQAFNTYQIDNHYCRYILENEVQNGNISSCMDAFENAHTILINDQKGNEKKHYPYRVAGLYHEFYNQFYHTLENHHKLRFLSACNEMLRKCEKYLRENTSVHSDNIKNIGHVKTTKKHLEFIIAENQNFLCINKIK